MNRKNCLICGDNNINKIIDLGMHPYADTFISKKNYFKLDKVYPLVVQMCNRCGNIQLECVTSPEERYLENEYSYTSSNSNFSKEYWNLYYHDVIKIYKGKKKLSILEIGSNDGYLLGLFKQNGHNVLGVDASPFMAKLSNKSGIKTISEIFDENIATQILSEYGKFDVVIANNVFNHSDDPKNFMRGVKRLLTDKGFFIFESPYWLDSIISGKFDQIYHEHVSYFTARSLKYLSRISNLKIIDATKSYYHGGSLRLIVGNYENNIGEEKINTLIEKEKFYNLYDKSFYENFNNVLINKKNIFMEKIYKIKISKSPIICVGAAAKANTFLNFYGLNNNLIDCVTDSSNNKIGKFTPLTRIPIHPDEILKEFSSPFIIFTAWNVSADLKKIISKINPNYKECNPYEN